MRSLKHLIENNRDWSAKVRNEDPAFFEKLSHQQSPEYLWIGCSDSRVPANQITGLLPGEIFVHRNVANLVVHTDFNCLSVIQYAVDVLKVKHVIVCGHYGCGGVMATMDKREVGLVDNWLRHLRDVEEKHQQILEALPNRADRYDRLAELNVIEQVLNVCQTTVVQQAWRRGADLSVHGWIYRITDGVLHDLNLCATSVDDTAVQYRRALTTLTAQP